MRKLALILLIAVFALSVAVPAFACDGQKTAAKDCAAVCAAHKAAGKDCPSRPGCVCPGHSKATTTEAKGNDNATVTSAVAKSGDKVSVDMTGEGCVGAKGASASKAGHSCTAEEKAACMGKGSMTSAKLPNGHPALSVADAMKCEGSMVAFLSVDKMTCNGCVQHVTKTLGSMDGVCAVDVSLDKKSAAVVFHPDQVKTDVIVATINKAGYVAAMKTECSDDMKAVFGENYKEQCLKSCANMCKEKQGAKKSSET